MPGDAHVPTYEAIDIVEAPSDGLPGAMGKVPDVLAWYAETSDLTDIARSERLAARFESALH